MTVAVVFQNSDEIGEKGEGEVSLGLDDRPPPAPARLIPPPSSPTNQGDKGRRDVKFG